MSESMGHYILAGIWCILTIQAISIDMGGVVILPAAFVLSHSLASIFEAQK